MRIAVFSDIHGNPYACQAVLDAIAEDGEFDGVVAAGDLCFGGSDPAGCIDMLGAAGVLAVRGNTDEYITMPDKMPPDELHRSQWKSILARVLWVRQQMTGAQLAWLAGLPLDVRFSPTGDAKDDLLVVHANPKNVHDFINAPIEEQARFDNPPPQPDDDPTLVSLLEDVQATIVAHGHLHFTSTRYWRQLMLVNVAPCSISPYDGDRRARYTIFEWLAGAWVITRRYVDYDYTQERDALKASDMPYKEGGLVFFED